MVGCSPDSCCGLAAGTCGIDCAGPGTRPSPKDTSGAASMPFGAGGSTRRLSGVLPVSGPSAAAGAVGCSLDGGWGPVWVCCAGSGVRDALWGGIGDSGSCVAAGVGAGAAAAAAGLRRAALGANFLPVVFSGHGLARAAHAGGRGLTVDEGTEGGGGLRRRRRVVAARGRRLCSAVVGRHGGRVVAGTWSRSSSSSAQTWIVAGVEAAIHARHGPGRPRDLLR